MFGLDRLNVPIDQRNQQRVALVADTHFKPLCNSAASIFNIAAADTADRSKLESLSIDHAVADHIAQVMLIHIQRRKIAARYRNRCTLKGIGGFLAFTIRPLGQDRVGLPLNSLDRQLSRFRTA